MERGHDTGTVAVEDDAGPRAYPRAQGQPRLSRRRPGRAPSQACSRQALTPVWIKRPENHEPPPSPALGRARLVGTRGIPCGRQCGCVQPCHEFPIAKPKSGRNHNPLVAGSGLSSGITPRRLVARASDPAHCRAYRSSSNPALRVMSCRAAGLASKRQRAALKLAPSGGVDSSTMGDDREASAV